jgi:alkanesulfonate monooxygenase SsuD/methylene tetrahydromethanopterin reductase-like flavin-dependent oxidoreductase (luciferase family)
MPAPTQANRNRFYSDNKLIIGLFGANCSSGRAVTALPNRWSGDWDDCLALARMADEAGIDFMLPIGRWKGYGGDSDYQGATYETINWASGLLALTQRITVFGTVHAPLFNPIMAAKMMMTADHIGKGRFGLNIVCGWNEGEFEMFGVDQRDHANRYRYAQEWCDVVKRAWSGEEVEFDYEGDFLRLKGVRAKPKPCGGARPVIMNAGASPEGQAFAIRNCDAYFTQASRDSLEASRQRIGDIKDAAKALGRDLEVYTVGVVTCRPTVQEAQDYYRYVTNEATDWTAVDSIMQIKGLTPENMGVEAYEKRRAQYANGMGGLPIIGDPDHVAAGFARLAEGGLRGIAVSMVNSLEELPYFAQEVLPRLARMGLRVAQPAIASEAKQSSPS